MNALYAINVKAPMILTQLFASNLISCRGQVIFLNSSAGIRSNAFNAIYASSKHSLKALADGFRSALNPHGVRISSIYPGRTATPMQESIFAAENRSYQPENLLQPEDISQIVLYCLKVPQNAEVTDIHLRPLKIPT